MARTSILSVTHFVFLLNFILPVWSAEVVAVWGDQSQGQGVLPAQTSDVATIASGTYHALAVTTDGSVLAWGANDAGQCAVPLLRRRAFAAAASADASFALLDDGTVQAWGGNADGQCDVPDGLDHVIALAAGGNHVLALLSDGTVRAWGANAHGESTVPNDLSGVIAIAAGLQHSLALRDDGTVVAWGDPANDRCAVPSSLSGVIAIAAGDTHSLALTVGGTVVGWGDDTLGAVTIPMSLSGVKSIVAGGSTSVALRVDGTVTVWGDDGDGRSDANTATGVIAITAGGGTILTLAGSQRSIASAGFTVATGLPPTQTGIVLVSTANGDTCGAALSSDGLMSVFGQWVNNRPPPLTLPLLKHLATGRSYVAGLGGDGSVGISMDTVWTDLWNYPSGISGRVKSIDADAGDGHLAVVLDDGTVRAWGTNFAQQTDVPLGLNGVKAISTGYWGSVALKSNGTVVPWGYADLYYSLLEVPAGLTGVKQVEDGTIYRMALRDDGTVVAWGRDEWNNVSGIPSGLSGVIAISAGYYVSYALKSDGTIVSWGGVPQSSSVKTMTVKSEASPQILASSAASSPRGMLSFSGGKDCWTGVQAGTSVPRVTISPRQGETNLYPIPFTIAFSQPVTTLTMSHITVTGGSPSTLTRLNNSTFRLLVTPTPGTVTVSVADGSVQNNLGTLATGGIASVISDRIPPIVTIDPAGGLLAALPTIVTFTADGPIEVGDLSRFHIVGGQLAGVTATSATTLTASYMPTAANSSLTCGSGVVKDRAGNPNVTAMATYTVPNPAVVMNGPKDQKVGAPFTITINFSTEVSGFGDGQINATNATLGPVNGSGSQYTVIVTPTADESVTVSVPLGAGTDAGSLPSLPQSITIPRHRSSSGGSGGCGIGGGSMGFFLLLFGLLRIASTGRTNRHSPTRP